MMRNILARTRNDERGAMGWALLWLLGIPIEWLDEQCSKETP
jgi:hypothetical protein